MKEGLISAIITLWNECRSPTYIAHKLGLLDPTGEPDTDFVEMVIENPDNYRRHSENPQSPRAS